MKLRQAFEAFLGHISKNNKTQGPIRSIDGPFFLLMVIVFSGQVYASNSPKWLVY